jgi:regulator of sigma E protease
MPESPAHKAGILPGDRIIAIDGKKIEHWAEQSEILRNHDGGQMTVTWSRRDSVFNTE